MVKKNIKNSSESYQSDDLIEVPSSDDLVEYEPDDEQTSLENKSNDEDMLQGRYKEEVEKAIERLHEKLAEDEIFYESFNKVLLDRKAKLREEEHVLRSLFHWTPAKWIDAGVEYRFLTMNENKSYSGLIGRIWESIRTKDIKAIRSFPTNDTLYNPVQTEAYFCIEKNNGQQYIIGNKTKDKKYVLGTIKCVEKMDTLPKIAHQSLSILEKLIFAFICCTLIVLPFFSIIVLSESYIMRDDINILYILEVTGLVLMFLQLWKTYVYEKIQYRFLFLRELSFWNYLKYLCKYSYLFFGLIFTSLLISALTMVTLFLSDGYFYEWLSRDILIQLLMLLIAFFYVALRIGMLKGIDYLMAINHEKYIEHKNDNFTLLVVMSIGLILSILWINFTFYYCPEVIEFVKSTSLLPETDIFEFLNDFFRVLIMIFYCCIIPYGIVIFCIYLFQKLHHSR